jgi:hypothetical protein
VAAPTTRRAAIRSGLALLGALTLTGGCGGRSGPQSSTPQANRGGNDGNARPPSPSANGAGPDAVVPISNTDPCATRLHDICQPLLLYYLQNGELPPRLDALQQMKGYAGLELTCPVTRRPYQYNPLGVMNPEVKRRLVIYDPAPSHSNMRWAVAIEDPKEGGVLVTKVVALPESNFTLQLPKK